MRINTFIYFLLVGLGGQSQSRGPALAVALAPDTPGLPWFHPSPPPSLFGSPDGLGDSGPRAPAIPAPYIQSLYNANPGRLNN